MFAASLENRLLLGTFGCGIDDGEGRKLLRRSIAEAEQMRIEK